jgi:hypothetical protein
MTQRSAYTADRTLPAEPESAGPNASPDATALAEAERHPVPVEPVERATAGAPASVATTPPSGNQNGAQTEAKVATPTAGGSAAASVESSTRANQDPARQATPSAQPTTQQAAVAHGTSDSVQTEGPPPNPGVGTGPARPAAMQAQPRPGTPQPSPSEAQRAQTGSPQGLTPAASNQAEAIAKITASLGIQPAPGLPCQTHRSGQPPAAALVKDRV